MRDEERIDPHHLRRRSGLRVLGVTLAVLGLLFTATGFVSFFTAFGTFEPPRYFWCAFVGLPLLGVGLGICQFAFLGSFSRFVAGEAAPVQRDTFNYLAEGTQPGVRSLARAAAEGISEGLARPAGTCPQCHQPTAPGAKFCSQCGAALPAR